jgi:uncharacterized protein
MLNENIAKILKTNASALISINSDNTPHAIAVACIKTIGKSKVIITDNFMKETVLNIKRNPNITLLVIDGDWKKSGCKAYEINGKAEYFTQGEWKEKVKNDRDNKGLAAKGAIILEVNKIKKSA